MLEAVNSKFDLVIGLMLFGKKKKRGCETTQGKRFRLVKKKYNVNNDVLDGLQISASGES